MGLAGTVGELGINKVLKRAHLADAFYYVKNSPEMKYQVCVIQSITQM